MNNVAEEEEEEEEEEEKEEEEEGDKDDTSVGMHGARVLQERLAA